MTKTLHANLLLAITLSTRGLGYVVFEAPMTPFDWRVVRIRGEAKNRQITKRVVALLETYRPAILVLENIQGKNARRTGRLKKLSLQLAHLAECEGIEVATYNRAAVREAFAPVGARSKAEIAQAIAQAIPAFTHRLPPVRKIWMSEDPRQMLFDAAALGMTHRQMPA